VNALEMLREARARLLRALDAWADGDDELARLILDDLEEDLAGWTDSERAA